MASAKKKSELKLTKFPDTQNVKKKYKVTMKFCRNPFQRIRNAFNYLKGNILLQLVQEYKILCELKQEFHRMKTISENFLMNLTEKETPKDCPSIAFVNRMFVSF